MSPSANDREDTAVQSSDETGQRQDIHLGAQRHVSSFSVL